jgi:hypothetical protein
VIGLNVLLYFREPARSAGLAAYLLWSAVVVAVGALMLLCILRLRQLRLGQRPRGPEPGPAGPGRKRLQERR